jgi:uncharacterized DUF497 family protein
MIRPKAIPNRAKHDIDFAAAQGLWHDHATITLSSVYPAEARWMRIAVFRGKCWTAIYTMRGMTVRLVSVGAAAKQKGIFMNSKMDKITSVDGRETISGAEFDRRFDDGEEMLRFMKVRGGARPGAGRKDLGKIRKQIKLTPAAAERYRRFAKRRGLNFSAAVEAASLTLR